jgi:Protein of Unknown function (DUF2784)
MSDAALADLVLIVHAAFVAWVVLGIVAVWRWPRLALLHLPALAWGVWIEWSGAICPLTPLEQRLRRAAGQAGYDGGFVERVLLGALYPEGLTREVQFMLGAIVLAVNVLGYGLLWWRSVSRPRKA